jgi:putative lipoic acid-binding regulatory protein
VEILDDKYQTKPDIDYPTSWGYKIIGRDLDELKTAIAEIMGDREHQLTAGHASKTGKFHSCNTHCIVADEEDRNQIFSAFSEHPSVKMVI